jgi:hypothetical protein
VKLIPAALAVFFFVVLSRAVEDRWGMRGKLWLLAGMVVASFILWLVARVLERMAHGGTRRRRRYRDE